jgi:hypothetical protein
MPMRWGRRAGRIVHFYNDERLAGDVRNRLIEFWHDRFGVAGMCQGQPGSPQGKGRAGNDGDGADFHKLSPSLSPKMG